MKKVYVFILLFIPFISFAQVQIGQDIDGEAEADFSGISVSLSFNGSLVSIGSFGGEGAGSNSFNSGHVRVFENQNGNWIQIGENIDGENASDQSGTRISQSADGNTLAIGSPVNSDVGLNSGHVRIFENQNGNWIQIGESIDGENAMDFFGNALSLSSDGSIVAIGAPQHLESGFNSGLVRIFENINGNWTQIGQDIDGELGDRFGTSISLSADGTIVAIGAPENDGFSNIDAGYASVFENQNGNWIQMGENINAENINDVFGISVSLSADGNILAIGAPANDGNGIFSGHVRVFENINGNWIQIGQDIDGENEGDQSGISTSLSADGNVVAIGSWLNADNGSNSGHVRIFQNINGNWIQIGENINGENEGDRSGTSISLSGDGNILVVGASQNDGNGNDSGHVRVFDLSGILATEESTIAQFELFPNPAKDILNIQLQLGETLETINIYNNIGQLVDTSDQLVIDASKLNSGLYFVEVVTAKGKISKKLIIE